MTREDRWVWGLAIAIIFGLAAFLTWNEAGLKSMLQIEPPNGRNSY